MEIGSIQLGPGAVSLIVTVVAGLILRALQPRAKVIWSEPNGFCYIIDRQRPDAPVFNVWTRSVFIQNVGKEAAEDVEVIFNWKPDHVNLFPIIPYNTETMQDRRYILRIPTLGPKEWVRFELLGENELPNTVRVRSKAGEAKAVVMGPLRMYPQWVNVTAACLMLIGVFAIVYHATAWLMKASAS